MKSILILSALLFLLIGTSCSSLSMNKDCRPVEGSNSKFMCKTVMPWEANVSWQGWLNAGQKVRAVGDSNITSPSLTTSATHTFMEIFRIK